MERLVFHILQDGTVEETVSGVKGPSCLDLTEKIEDALGVVRYRKQKPEFFQQENVTFQHDQNEIKEQD